jgi:hypothetical protein
MSQRSSRLSWRWRSRPFPISITISSSPQAFSIEVAFEVSPSQVLAFSLAIASQA